MITPSQIHALAFKTAKQCSRAATEDYMIDVIERALTELYRELRPYNGQAMSVQEHDEIVAKLQQEHEARFREFIPIVCCYGSNPQCFGPKGCLLVALPADEQQKRIDQLERALAAALAVLEKAALPLTSSKTCRAPTK